ncbi:hypothetical protein ACQJ7O_00830 [Helicobacter pylori]
MGHWFGNPSNDTQENPKDALKKEEALKKFQEENTKLNSKITGLSTEKENLTKEKTDLTDKNQKLTTEKDNLANQLNASQKRVNELEQSQQVLQNEKADLNSKITGLSTEKDELTDKNQKLTAEKENLTNQLNESQKQASQTSQKLNELEQKHAPYQKLEKLYEVFLEVKDRLNFNFVATTHSAMDLIASVLSDSKYYLESLYNRASQELGDKRSDKGEKLAELFDLLFEYVKDSKFERLKEPSAYDYSCKKLYPEQNTSQKMRRVVLRGYKHNDKMYHTIVDMGS